MPENLKGMCESLMFMVMAIRSGEGQPSREHLVLRAKAGVVQGIIITLTATAILWFVSDTFVSKNDITDTKFVQVEKSIANSQVNILKAIEKSDIEFEKKLLEIKRQQLETNREIKEVKSTIVEMDKRLTVQERINGSWEVHSGE